MKLKPYEYICLLHPAEDDKKTKTKIVVERAFILAKNEEDAKRKAIREIPKENEEELDQVEVIVRPF